VRSVIRTRDKKCDLQISREKGKLHNKHSKKRRTTGLFLGTFFIIGAAFRKSYITSTTMAETVHLSKLRQAMKNARPTSFSDIPVSAVVANMFHYLENRTDWNNFALASKEINKAVTGHNDLSPPWPKGQLIHDSIDDYSRPKFSHDGEFIAYSNSRGHIHIWSRRKGLVASSEGDARNSSLSFSPSSNLLVSIGYDDRIKLWDLANNNQCRWTQQEDTEFHDTVVFSPTGDVFATFGYPDRLVFVRSILDGSISKKIRSYIGMKFGVALSPEGHTLAVCGNAHSVELWDLNDSGSTCTILDGHTGFVLDIAYSPAGNFLASASNDKTIRIWDMENCNRQRCVRSLTGHTEPVRFLSFSPDGKFLASAGDENDIRVWSMDNGNCVETVNVSSLVRSVEFSHDGKMLLTKEGEDVIRLRSVNLGST
jgi:WD40 repeat protein